MKFGFKGNIVQFLNRPIKLRWAIRAFLIAAFIASFITACLIGRETMVELSERSRVEAIAKENFSIRRQFVKTETEQIYGTIWDYCNVTIGARHVHEETRGVLPPAALGAALPTSPNVDAVFYGSDWNCEFARNPIDGERIWLMGYPAASDALSTRRGTVFLKRSATDTYIVLFDPYSIADFFGEPVSGGMSGGIVMSEDLEPIGILITQNSQFDSDEDGESENGADVVGLKTAVDILIGESHAVGH